MSFASSDHPLPQFAACVAAETETVESILARHHDGAGGASGLSPMQLRRVLLFVEQNLDDDLSLVTLAAVAGLSPSHFARRFKAALGEAPHRYVLARRVNWAKRLLLETEMPLAEIAAAAGFSSQAHLTGIFGRAVGVTPGAYRTRRNQCLAFLMAGGVKESFNKAA
ncbi:helix-turn-helix domain-containing protein [Niveispirillum sp.]|uniref:helix-turn-helix domain-containing protein n=1 Tax=Niveispirillum sp. TaxID=1917217 RepID=UPI001B5002E3|nr:AraC family transcriptional regulator [Niveispirillum sp.]MBP7336362.1 helix-turn-helix transcriptional regulator [Niveispirillum sp.]